MNNSNLEIDLTDLHKTLNKLVNQRVNLATQDIENWKQVTNFIYISICEELETATQIKQELSNLQFTINAVEAEGYVRGLFKAKELIEEWITKSGLQLDE